MSAALRIVDRLEPNRNLTAPFRSKLHLIYRNIGVSDQQKKMSAHRIAIVDDDDAVRVSTARLLESAGHRVHSFANGDDFLKARLPEGLNCVLLDMRMPGLSGLDVLRAIGDQDNPPSGLMLTGHGDIPLAVEAMKLGAIDFIEKPYAPRKLLDAIESASELYEQSQAQQSGNREAEKLVESLSERQRQVLHGIVRGRPNKIIAYELSLSIRTVEAYRAQMLEKLGVRSTAEAVRIAIAAGLTAH
jgi:two-component system, LuxR family, response regulator FixJ